MKHKVSIWNYQEQAANRRESRLARLRDAGYPNPDAEYARLADEVNRVEPKSERDWSQQGKRVWHGGHDPELHANKWLRDCSEAVKPFFSGVVSDVPTIAKQLADRWGAMMRMCGVFDGKDPHQPARKPIKRLETDEDRAWFRLITNAESFLNTLHLPFPTGQTVRTAMKRLGKAKWWREQLNIAIPRIFDQMGRDYHLVHKNGQIYLTDAAFNVWKSSQRMNRETLQGRIGINDIDQVYSLADLSDKSTSAPHIRRTEMMVRMRGLEEYAQEIGFDKALFITITAPSKYHSHDQKGVPYANWNHSDPRTVNDYLGGVWSRIRADLARREIKYFGVRVAEPHHDGCPHWHLLIFTRRFDALDVNATCRHYALEEDREEKGARTKRCVIKWINPERGSAVGYIAKYISKSIDGKGLDKDLEGYDAKDAAARNRAWASTWGIRQFQFFGTAPIGPWRELRRCRRTVPEPYETARQAADNAEFAAYLREAVGEGFAVYRDWVNRKTGEIIDPFNEYGELVTAPIKGVIADGHDPLITRLMDWSIMSLDEARQRGIVASEARSGECREAWTCVSNCTRDLFFEPGIIELTNDYLEEVPIPI